ncbi:DUF4114 domain-containing protein [Oscillatoria sp. CS-180]|uniref:DUF4114 domain-containing protein n=1 Tax=Oscillatoria sp. CS-180 TaxID=3021720 RepID=UPI00232E440C|nr:DUF4114 domain-containing protein [Oscillatoria sp. CS-180]MDB9528895.1 DUF4114 domain-containing protein [Oscillatoria sp. CS-180]
MKVKFLKHFFLGAALLSTSLMATEAQAFTFNVTEAQNLKEQNQELFRFFRNSVNQERNHLAENQLTPLDANDLLFNTAKGVEVYFIHEGAGYKNQILFSADGAEPEILFENASKRGSGGSMSYGEGLVINDFDGLPEIAQFDLFIASDGYRNPNARNNLYGADASKNSDGINHITAFSHVDEKTGERYTFMGFEDLPNGGDRDFNDVVLVVRGVSDSADDLVEVPEPASTTAMLGLGAVGVMIRRKRSSTLA